MVFEKIHNKSLLLSAILVLFSLPAFAGFQVTTASATPASAANGQTVTLSAAIQSSVQATNMIVDLEIYDAANAKIAQKVAQNQNFTAGKAVQYRWAYSVPVTAAAGKYTLKIGISTANWTTLQYWNNAATSFSVTTIAAASNGTCGTANGQSFATAPSSNLCSAGTGSAVTGNGPWTWSCAGANGGSTASCSASKTTAVGSQGSVPQGLPNTLFVGLAVQPNYQMSWVKSSGVPWAMCYQYISSGVSPSQSWVTTWGTNFAYNYAVSAHGLGCIPELTYYQIVPSGGEGAQTEYNTLNNAATMANYYRDFTALMKQLRSYGSTAVVHVEPDLWAYLQLLNSNPAALSAAVASSGVADVAGYSNTVVGFGQALLHLRDVYAPNVVMAAHVSGWLWAGSTDPLLNVATYAKSDAAFMTALGNWDLFFTDVSDRDAAFYQYVYNDGGARWWDVNNQKYPNFNRFNAWATAFTQAAHKRLVVWQVPIGNTVMRTMDNTHLHYQDNREQYWLSNYPNSQAMSELAKAGVIGLLFGAGDGNTTENYDAAGDGITNPAAINGNTQVSSYADDDGGLLRINVGNYYRAGATPLP